MKKLLEVSKEQTRLLYNLLSNYQINSASDNRKRWQFIEVFQDYVFEFEDDLEKLAEEKGLTLKQRNDKASKFGEQTKEFTFNDRAAFVKIKDFFEKSFAVGAISRNSMGKVERSALTGREARIYTELENAFMNVKEIENKKKK